MTIVNCPKCQEQVTIPAHVSPRALVQCPLCQETFLLSDALTQLPPELIVVRDVAAPDDHAGREKDEEEPVPLSAPVGDWKGGHEVPVAAIDDETNAPAFRFASAGVTTPRQTAVSRSARLRRRSGHPIRHVVQIVLGGVAGILIAQIILWWIPAKLSVANRDLTGLGRKYGRYVPFLVPSSIRGAAEGSGLADSSDEPRQATVPSRNRKAPARDVPAIPDYQFAEAHLKANPPAELDELDRIADSPVPETNDQAGPTPVEAVLPAEKQGGAGSSALGAAPPAPPATADSQTSGQEGDKASQPLGIDIPSIELKPPMPVETPPLPAVPPSASSLPANSPTNPGNGVDERLAAALKASAELDAAAAVPVEKKRPLMADFYRTLAGLGESLAASDPNDDKAADELARAGQLLQKVAGQPDRLNLIAAATPMWLKSQRSHNGICLVGRVQSSVADGEFRTATVELKDGQTMTVMLRRDPSRELANGINLLVLGAMLEPPDAKPAGQSGDAPRTVLEGLSFPLPANGLP